MLILPGIAPALAALLVNWATQGGTGVQHLFRPLRRWRVGWLWYGVAIAAPLGLLLLAKGVTVLLGLSGDSTESTQEGVSQVVTALITSILANPWEEVGWRRFVLPHWQQRFTALTASLILGGW